MMENVLTHARIISKNCENLPERQYFNNYRYEAHEIGFTKTDGLFYGMSFYFEKEVQVTEAMFAIEPLTLLTRIGGILGVGRTLVWLINVFFSNIIYLCSIFKESF